MCGVTDQLSSKSQAPSSSPPSESLAKEMKNPAESEVVKYSFSDLLEFAANNDVEGFKRSVSNGSAIDGIGLWYGFQSVLRKMVVEQRTPLMVAAKYGSLDVVRLILSLSEVDISRRCGVDQTTALHCAASGGSVNSVDVVKMLLSSGADPSLTDANGYHPFDVIAAPPNQPQVRASLEDLLVYGDFASRLESVRVRSGSPTLPPSLEGDSLTSKGDSSSPRLTSKPASEKKEYPVDPSLPDIKSSFYSTDEFRMFSFKIRPCSRAYSHDWTECPFAHPGENARRRDPRKYHYSCMPCPDFKKGSCKRGDLCEYAHGVFECWLHPAQYRTRLCKDGTNCNRRVCFFAHKPEELRPLNASTGSALSSPRSATAGATVMDMAAALNMFPGSPSAISAMSPSTFTPPMSPSGNNMSQSTMVYPQQNVPTLHLPGSNLQTSRLRSSLNARDLPAEELGMFQELDMQRQQLLNDMSCISPHHGASAANHAVRSKLAPANLDEMFSAEVSSPRYADQLSGSVYSPQQKSALFNQLQQLQNRLSPIKTNAFSPKKLDNPLLQASFGLSSPGVMPPMSPRSVETMSPMSARLAALNHREKQPQQLRSFSSRELGSKIPADIGFNSAVGSPVSRWKYPDGEADWSVQADELANLCRSRSSGLNAGEPDVSWVQTLVKEAPNDAKETVSAPVSGAALSVEVPNSNSQTDSNNHEILGAWLDQLQLDQIVA